MLICLRDASLVIEIDKLTRWSWLQSTGQYSNERCLPWVALSFDWFFALLSSSLLVRRADEWRSTVPLTSFIVRERECSKSPIEGLTADSLGLNKSWRPSTATTCRSGGVFMDVWNSLNRAKAMASTRWSHYRRLDPRKRLWKAFLCCRDKRRRPEIAIIGIIRSAFLKLVRFWRYIGRYYTTCVIEPVDHTGTLFFGGKFIVFCSFVFLSSWLSTNQNVTLNMGYRMRLV